MTHTMGGGPELSAGQYQSRPQLQTAAHKTLPRACRGLLPENRPPAPLYTMCRICPGLDHLHRPYTVCRPNEPNLHVFRFLHIVYILPPDERGGCKPQQSGKTTKKKKNNKKPLPPSPAVHAGALRQSKPSVVPAC